jgi:hypothetical protein
VIGVYEPAVQVLGDAVRITSRAAQRDLSASTPGLLYHGLCYERSRRAEKRCGSQAPR